MNMVAVRPTPDLIGQDVTVWALSDNGNWTSGQGGTVTAVEGNHPAIRVTINAPGDRLFTWVCDDVHYQCVVDEPLDPSECLEHHRGDCEGLVDYRAVRDGPAHPRCVKHFDKRLAQYENSMEKYADSDCVPDWFSEADIGEHWGPEDY